MCSHETMSNSEDGKLGKKVFDKKKWREERYSVKAKVKRWEERRRKNMLTQYRKELKKSGMNINQKCENYQKNMNSFKKAELQYQKIKEDKQRKKEEREKVKAERNEALKAYRERKAARFKKLSQKTKKGQPVMRGLIELMLEKIEKNYAHQNT